MKPIARIKPEIHMILMHIYNIQEIIHYNKDKISEKDIDMINGFERKLKEFKNKL